jgi:hypothetical protein
MKMHSFSRWLTVFCTVSQATDQGAKLTPVTIPNRPEVALGWRCPRRRRYPYSKLMRRCLEAGLHHPEGNP